MNPSQDLCNRADCRHKWLLTPVGTACTFDQNWYFDGLLSSDVVKPCGAYWDSFYSRTADFVPRREFQTAADKYGETVGNVVAASLGVCFESVMRTGSCKVHENPVIFDLDAHHLARVEGTTLMLNVAAAYLIDLPSSGIGLFGPNVTISPDLFPGQFDPAKPNSGLQGVRELAKQLEAPLPADVFLGTLREGAIADFSHSSALLLDERLRRLKQ